MKPDFSPEMLRLFVRGRCLHGVNSGLFKDVKTTKAALRKAAGVTAAALDVAWAGRLTKASTRLKLWGALGVVPADYGIILTDDGGQCLASRAEGAPAGRGTARDGRSPLPSVADGSTDIKNGGHCHAGQ